MTTPLGRRIKTIFVDEFHDLIAPHPGRKQAWDDACRTITGTPTQLVFASATHPPHMHEIFLRKARLIDSPVRVIRASTDRPELGYYVLNLERTLWPSTVNLVQRLKELLEPDERILVFFEKREDVDTFSLTADCAVYHSQLPSDGENTKARNLNRWDSGDSPVMAATTAAGQGIDRPYVKFVIIHGGTFGMLPYAQQGGRGGRGGRPSYVILLRDPRDHQARSRRKDVPDDVNCIGPFLDYAANKIVCRRKALLDVMDGKDESFSCLDKQGCNPCDLCDPDGYTLKLVQDAVMSIAPSRSPPHITTSHHLPKPGPKVTPKGARPRADGEGRHGTLSQGSEDSYFLGPTVTTLPGQITDKVGGGKWSGKVRDS